MSIDPETLAAYAAEADRYRTLVSRDKPDGALAAFMANLPAGGHILDLGCGPGNSAAMMQDAGFEVTATDASPEMVQIARESYGIAARQAGFGDLTDEGTFDGIWANFSLLHAPKSALPGYLTRIATALRRPGLLHIGMKTGTGEKRDSLGRYYAYYTVPELRGLLEDAGFTVTYERQGEAEGLTGAREPFVILRATV